ncbi:MAG: helix-turn-helix transcriptional regulator [Clostridia bacterium]|nr:helix-turn-helix transcriptional regulator [Clostridia bacterium]
MIQVHYSQRIRDLREDKKKTQKEIAEVLKTTQSYYAQYENKHRPLPIEHLISLCKYYDVSPDYILGFTNEAKPLPKK